MGGKGATVVTGEEECLKVTKGREQELQVAASLAVVGRRFGLESQSDSAWLPCLSTALLWL